MHTTYIHTYNINMIHNIHSCMHTYVHTYIHIYIHTYTYTYIHTGGYSAPCSEDEDAAGRAGLDCHRQAPGPESVPHRREEREGMTHTYIHTYILTYIHTNKHT